MFSAYSPALASDSGTLSVLVAVGLLVGDVAALFVLAVSGERDVHASIQIIKNTITTTRPRAAVFHQSCGSLLNTLSIVLLPSSFNSAAFYFSLFPDLTTPKWPSQQIRWGAPALSCRHVNGGVVNGRLILRFNPSRLSVNYSCPIISKISPKK